MKRCSKCGTKFEEGIFCPECGTRVDSEDFEKPIMENDDTEINQEQDLKIKIEKRKQELEYEALKRKQELEYEAEKRKKELEFEVNKRKQELEFQAEQEKKEQEEKRRTVRGRVYSSQPEADEAKKQHELLDSLIKELSYEKILKRQDILKSFDAGKITVKEVKDRFDKLSEKVNAKDARAPLYCRKVGLSSLAALIICIITGVLVEGSKNDALAIVAMIAACWVWVSFIWWIVWSLKIKAKKVSKKSNYYLKDI
jgi:hypothetical protein